MRRRIPLLAAIVVALVLALGPRVVFAQDVPDPGPPSGDGTGGGVDLGPVWGGLGALAEAVGSGFDRLGFAAQWTIAYLPRLIATGLFAVVGLVALGLMKVFNLGDLGTMLVQTPLAAFQVPWMQTMALGLKGVALLLLAPMLAWSGAGLQLGALEDDLGDLARRFLIGALLVATIDQWAALAIQATNGLSVAAAGDVAVPGLADAIRMAQEASVAIPAPVNGMFDEPSQEILRQSAEDFARLAEGLAAQGVVSLLWAVAGVFAGAAALARMGWLQALYILAPVAVVFLVAPVGGLIARVWAAAFFGALFVQ